MFSKAFRDFVSRVVTDPELEADFDWFTGNYGPLRQWRKKELILVPPSRVLPEGQAADQQALLRHAMQGAALSLFGTCLTDDEACELPGVSKELAAGIRAMRKVNTDWGVSVRASLNRLVDPVLHLWFGMKQAARHCGPCNGDFQYMKDWEYNGFAEEFRKTTGRYLVIGSPMAVPDSGFKSMDGQKDLLARLSKKLNLGFNLTHGSAALDAYLALSHLHQTGGEQNDERLPANHDWIRTDSKSCGDRLYLRWRGDGRLYCGHWYWFDDDRHGDVRCLALGVVALGC